jgi:hypothetical protein
MEHEEQAERMEQDAERMEHHSEQLGERIDDVQGDWESKEQDAAVPGARPDPDADGDDEEAGAVTETPEQSDQLPEEGAPEYVEDDPGSGTGEGTDNPGVPGEDETSTGNPDNAGADE